MGSGEAHNLPHRARLPNVFYCILGINLHLKKITVFPYSLPSVGPGADPGVQAVSPQVTLVNHAIDLAVGCHYFLPACGYLRSFHLMALPVNGSTHLIPAYYSFIDPKRMKGWVGLVGWPIADGLPTLVVTHQLQVERRTGKVRQPETDILPTVPRHHVKEHKYACKNWSTDPDFSRHGFSFSKHVRASRHVFRLWCSTGVSLNTRTRCVDTAGQRNCWADWWSLGPPVLSAAA